ncbi:carbonic anhydrase-like [Asterias rubens]|uniref:carbonic anhydrase-like n=1 Tax=Asterias rubens TaxID=7604 RepID=UPI001455B784|nr:carbonic anhydrase-like [Asterias rubens]
MDTLMQLCGLCLLLIIPVVHTVPWGYPQTKPGTDYWPKIYPMYCAGLSQSPIDIRSTAAIKMEPVSFDLLGFGAQLPRNANIVVQNSGLSAQVKLKGDYFVSGGGLPGAQYKAASIHFHWGSTNDRGSEHTVDGRQAPAEMHIVTHDVRFATVSEAAYKVDGLAVLGFFIEIQAQPNPGFQALVDALGKLKYNGDTFTLPAPFALSDLLPNTNIMMPYFRYRGSLTTPTCNEVVVWTVFKMPIRLSQAQLNVFRRLLETSAGAPVERPLVDNWRPTQPLNGRLVYHSAGVLRSN